MGQALSNIQTEETAESLGLCLITSGEMPDVSKLSSLGQKIYHDHMVNKDKRDEEDKRLARESLNIMNTPMMIKEENLAGLNDEEQLIYAKVFYESYLLPNLQALGLTLRLEYGSVSQMRIVHEGDKGVLVVTTTK